MLIKYFLEKYDQKLLNTRDKAKYRHKGYRENTVKTVLGEVTYKRAMYLVKENGKEKYIFLLDETLEIPVEGKISQNLAQTALEIVAESVSYRKAAETISKTTNQVISHEALRKLTINVGNKLAQKEKEEVKLMKNNQIKKGSKIIPALFEEADGIWINLQGKDRKKALDKQKISKEKQGRKFNSQAKVKTELKLHVMYEGWKKGDVRHSLVNKKAIAGIMKPKEIRELRDARVYREYDEEKIELRVTNGDGATWTKGTKAKGGIYQKDKFHIEQEIIRDLPPKYRKLIKELLNKKEYKKILEVIELLKYEVDGEEKSIKKLNKLKSYLSKDIERYQEVLERTGKKVPEAPEGIEYRNLGTQESQIYSFLKVRFCSGRKSFSIEGANSLAKVCVLVKEQEEIFEEINKTIPVEIDAKEWIEEIEKNIKKGYRKVGINNNFEEISNVKTSRLSNAPKYIKEMVKEIDFLDMRCSF